MSLLLDLKKGINKSSQYLLTNLKKITTYEKIDDKLLQELEEILIGADLGISVTRKLISVIKSKKYDKNISLEDWEDDDSSFFSGVSVASRMKAGGFAAVIVLLLYP